MSIFSVIIPAYNRKVLLKKAVDSVLSQTFPEFELIVIDDGSTDGTKELISGYNDSRINYFYQENKGPSSARNCGIQTACSDYICFLDSDDCWDKDKLKIQNKYIKKYPDHKIFHTQEIWYRNGKLLPQKEKHEKPNGLIFPQCLPLCCVSISTATIHKSVFSEIGMFDENLPACEDYDFWLSVSLKYPVFLIDQPLTLKDGGRPDQQSQRIKCLDKYRIIALLNFLNNNPLTPEQKEITLKELNRKIGIYTKGCLKRGKIEEAEYFKKYEIPCASNSR